MTGPEHSCGVVGAVADGDVMFHIHRSLNVIQHRGQESAGISTFLENSMRTVKGDGLVSDALNEEKMRGFNGNIAIGHVRYSTAGSKGDINAQPMVVDYIKGKVAIAHNGELTNHKELRAKYQESGWGFMSDSDAEIIAKILAKNLAQTDDPVDAMRAMMSELDGAYTLVILINDRLFALRDTYGFKPLCIGKISKGYMVVSESNAIDSVGGTFVRDVEAGEIVEILRDGVKSYPLEKPMPKAHCMFEWIYFARPDAVIDGREVYDVRKKIGMILAEEAPADVDVIMPIPDSGRAHALGYSIMSGIPYEEGFMKNRFVGRTFILPSQEEREAAVSSKMNPIKSTIEGKRILVVDDSIVRGTTLKILIKSLKNAGAKEVHVRVGSPPIIAPCYYGVDMKDRKEFIATKYSVEEIREIIGADSLAYISLEGMVRALEIPADDLCLACANAKYPTFIPGEAHRFQSE